MIPMTGVFTTRISTMYGIMFIYNFTEPFEPLLIQTVNKYYTLPNAKMLIPSPIDSITIDDYILLLDTNIGVITYVQDSSGFFLESDYFDLSRFGNSYSLNYEQSDLNSQNVISVGTDTGLITFNEARFDEVFWVYSDDIYGDDAPVLSNKHSSGYFFLDVQGINSTSLMIVDDRSPYSQDVLLHLDIQNLVGDSFDSNGLWEIFEGAIGQFYYTRFDSNGLKC